FAVDEPAGVVFRVEHARTRVDRCPHARGEEIIVDSRGCERPGACANLRCGGPGADGEKAAVVRAQFDRVAGARLTVDTLDRAGVDPGVALAQRLLPAGPERDDGRARGGHGTGQTRGRGSPRVIRPSAPSPRRSRP